ncbi:MAG: class I SAM-dependent methyltransferase [Parcubacteria group bacterium]
MKKEIVQKILNETEFGYDFMAGKFSETRKYFWREMEFIGDYAKNEDAVLDFGCGNGRLLELFSDKNIKYQGVDVSKKLIELADSRYYSENVRFSKIDPSQESLPFPDNFFDTVYAIAVFHHFPGKEYREAMAKELYRTVKPGGYVVITAWNLWPASLRQVVVSASRGGQKKYVRNIIENWRDKILGRSNLDWNDCYITFKDNEGNIFKRYHHAFTSRGLKRLFLEAGFKKEKVANNKNLVFIGRKK